LAGYNVYRAVISGGPYARVSPTLSPTSVSFVDTSPSSGQTYFYVVTAVGGSGVESVVSNEVAVNVP
jgi:fibronectin type 3 domain-containing protein